MHFLRDLRGHVCRDQRAALARSSARSTAQGRDEARHPLRDAVEELERRLPKIAALLEDAEADVRAFYVFPVERRPKIRSRTQLSV